MSLARRQRYALTLVAALMPTEAITTLQFVTRLERDSSLPAFTAIVTGLIFGMFPGASQHALRI